MRTVLLDKVSRALNFNLETFAQVAEFPRLLLNSPHFYDGATRAEGEGIMGDHLGFTGDALITDAVGDNAERTTSAEIEAYIGARLPAQ